MKSNVKRKRIWAACLCFMFALTTAIGLLALPLKTYAVAGNENIETLKFRQVAAGEDFAIGLTYSGDLYGWSLREDRADTVSYNNGVDGSVKGQTLGQYYPAKPIRIDVSFTYAEYSGNEINTAGKAANPQGGYVGGIEPIKQIAATRTTAAFLTQKGLIYTWGSNTDTERTVRGDESIGLLLRHNSANYTQPNSYFVPAMINYTGIGDVTFNFVFPIDRESGYAHAVNSISASEYNYMVNYTPNGENAQVANFIWGQSIYNQQTASGSHKFVRTNNGMATQLVTGKQAYIGDGNVYYVEDNALKVTGKNYSVPDTAAVSGGVLTNTYNTLMVVDNDHPDYDAGASEGDPAKTGITNKGYTFYDKSAVDAEGETKGRPDVSFDGAVIRGFKDMSKDSAITSVTVSGSSNAAFYDSEGKIVSGVSAVYTKFSAGAGYGYLLDSSGNLLYWGDARLGQDGSGSGKNNDFKIKNSATLTGKYVQVIAGKVLTGKPVLESFGTVGVGGALLDSATPDYTKWALNDEEDTQALSGALKPDYTDKESYISAVLSADGTVKAWGAKSKTSILGATKVDFTKYGVDTDSENNTAHNKIVYLAGGYGNNLFAISSYGKIFRIYINEEDRFACEMYDEFYTSSGKINNREFNNGGKATFATGYYEENVAAMAEGEDNDTDKKEPANSAVISLKSVTEKGNGSKTTAVSVEAVSDNKSGDARRMIIPSRMTVTENIDGSPVTRDLFKVNRYAQTDEKGTLGLGAEFESPKDYNLIDLSSDNTSYPLKFYWSSDKDYSYPIDADIAFRYFDIEYRYKTAYTDTENSEKSRGSEIDFIVTPKRSTGSQSIIIKYPVGRYASNIDFDDVDTGSPIFYEVNYVNVEIKIQNTVLTQEFTTKTVYDGEDVSTVPLLDANNPYNNSYSIALMDVSAGFTEVLTALEKLQSEHSGVMELTDDGQSIINKVALKDKGFPASSKISDGNLKYYNKHAVLYYNDAYRYLASDIDGDVLELINIANAENVTGIKDQSVTLGGIELFTYTLSDDIEINFEFKTTFTDENARKDFLDDLNDLFVGTLDTTSGLNIPAKFDNRFGFEISNITETGITVKYKVITITAKHSMDGTFVSYDNNEISNPKLQLSQSNRDEGVTQLIRPTLSDGSNGGNIPFGNLNTLHRGIEVFVQSSLTMDADKVGNETIVGAPSGTEFVDNSKKNTYNMPKIELEIEDEGSEYEFNLSRYFKDDSAIEIAYKGAVGSDSLKELQESFNGKDNSDLNVSVSSAAKMISVSEKSFKIQARTLIDNFKFSIEIRRVQQTPSKNTFLYGDKEAESITVNFVVAFKYSSKSDTWKKSSNPTEPPMVNQITRFGISNRLSVNKDVLANCTVVPVSSNNDILTVTWNSANNEFVLVPVTSGTVYVKYSVKLFGENEHVITDSFPVQVVMLVTLPQTVHVSNTVQVQISNLKSALRKATSSTKNFELDTARSPYCQKGILKETAQEPYDDNDYEWTPQSDDNENIKEQYKIPFLRNVFVDSTGTYIGISMGTYNPTVDKEENTLYRIVAEFTSGNERYKVAFKVAPAEQSLSDNGSILNLEINKADKTISITNRNNGIEAARSEGLVYTDDGYEIPVKFMAQLMDGYDDEKNYTFITAQAVSSDGVEDYSEYVDVIMKGVGEKEFYIVPLYPTAHSSTGNCNIRVSLRGTSLNADEVTVLNFNVTVTGIKTVLTKSEYKTVIIASFFGVLALLVIIFFIRMGIYWKKKAEQRKIIKKNQVLIKMREKMHNKADAVSKEKLVKTKLKMEDPKYAKMFTDMRKQREDETGISLENSYVANKAERKVKAEKARKKRGKMSLADLQAELQAKRESVARMQMGDFGAVQDGVQVDGVPIDDVPPVVNVSEETPIDGVPVFDPNVGFDGMTPEQLDEQFRAAMADDGIMFESPEDGSDNN